MKKLETAPVRGPRATASPGLEQDLEYYLIEQTGMHERRTLALIEKMRAVIGVKDLGEIYISPEIDLSQPELDPTARPRVSPKKAFMDLMIYILENR